MGKHVRIALSCGVKRAFQSNPKWEFAGWSFPSSQILLSLAESSEKLSVKEYGITETKHPVSRIKTSAKMRRREAGVDEAVPGGAGPAFGAGRPCWVWGLLGVPRLRSWMRIPSADAERRGWSED